MSSQLAIETAQPGADFDVQSDLNVGNAGVFARKCSEASQASENQRLRRFSATLWRSCLSHHGCSELPRLVRVEDVSPVRAARFASLPADTRSFAQNRRLPLRRTEACGRLGTCPARAST